MKNNLDSFQNDLIIGKTDNTMMLILPKYIKIIDIKNITYNKQWFTFKFKTGQNINIFLQHTLNEQILKLDNLFITEFDIDNSDLLLLKENGKYC